MSSIEDLVDRIQVQDFVNAQTVFGELMSDRLADALEQAKIRVAGEMFNDNVDDETDEDLEELSDEEIDEILDDEDEE